MNESAKTPRAPQVMEHDLEIRVRYQETDAMGILHHANYFTFFEIGRTELLRINGYCYRDLEASGVFMVVVKIQCRYHSPAKYDDVLTLRTRTIRVTVGRIEHEYRVFRDDVLLAEGQSVLACVDGEGRLQRVPERLRTNK